MGLAAPDHTVPYGTVLWRTLSQALRARLRSVRPYGTGLQTGSQWHLANEREQFRNTLRRPFGAIKHPKIALNSPFLTDSFTPLAYNQVDRIGSDSIEPFRSAIHSCLRSL
jgi:hypothetical protein